MLQLPPVPDPHRYAGLFVLEREDHTAVGYTAGEIALLRGTDEYAACRFWQIYRVHELGGFELRAMSEASLATQEAWCIQRKDAAEARRDFRSMVAAAEEEPVTFPAEVHLARLYDFEPQNVTTILYDGPAAPLVSGWLEHLNIEGNPPMQVGAEARDRFLSANGIRMDAATLNPALDYTDRPLDLLLANIDRALQR